jgi:hypothetical protein
MPNYMGNFPMGGFVLLHLRNHALKKGPRFVSNLIIDIGSFTADLSLAVLDADRDGDCIAEATQHSFELGLVEHYEKPLFETLLRTKGLQWNDLTFRDRERIKDVLNGDTRIDVATLASGTVAFGTAEDRAAAQALATNFAQQLTAVIQRFTAGREFQHVILTGGGVAIEKLHATLSHQLQSRGAHVLPKSARGEAPVANASGPAATVNWEDTSETLERVATAIGASSVLMDLTVHEPPPVQEPELTAEPRWTICSCNGGNKDCAKCGGVGMYER